MKPGDVNADLPESASAFKKEEAKMPWHWWVLAAIKDQRSVRAVERHKLCGEELVNCLNSLPNSIQSIVDFISRTKMEAKVIVV